MYESLSSDWFLTLAYGSTIIALLGYAGFSYLTLRSHLRFWERDHHQHGRGTTSAVPLSTSPSPSNPSTSQGGAAGHS